MMRKILKENFGFEQFLPLQEEIIRGVLARRDALVLMPTGGGKSLCYQLPALMLPGVTLVVSPLIALMKDQVDALKANGIAGAFINSTLAPREIQRIQGEARQGRLKILYIAPERLAMPEFQVFLEEIRVSLIAVDESHCISEWGHDFRPDYRNLQILKNIFPGAPTLALTATATERVRQDIVHQLALNRPQTFISGFNRPNLSYTVLVKENPYRQLLGILGEHRRQPAIIYCFARKDTERLAGDLKEDGFQALPYHAGLEVEERSRNQEKFIRDEVQIIVATIAFGMGIDKPDVRLIVHYHLPKSIEGYYQETGRAGRDGLKASCVLFYAYADAIRQEYFLKQIEDGQERSNAYQKLERMVAYCELSSCRRDYLLNYFGEDYQEDNCRGCDICLAPPEEFDATIITQKIMSAILRTGQRFGINYVLDVLLGAKNPKIDERGHRQLPVFGIAGDFSKEELRRIAGQLLARRLLEMKGGAYPFLVLTPLGGDWLRQRETIRLPRLKPRAKKEQPREEPETSYDKELFGQLRQLRKKLAEEKGVPPYVVFGDLALMQMAAYLPQGDENFSRISGVGQEKLRQYGPVFMEVIRNYAGKKNLPEQDIPRRRPSGHQSPWERRVKRKGSTYQETKNLALQKKSLEEMARLRGMTPAIICGHLEKLVNAGEDLDLAYLKPREERFAQIRAAFQRSGGRALTPVKEMLGGDFSYDELHLARLFLE
jgi:ATP-dependent DNA helicase RecQ